MSLLYIYFFFQNVPFVISYFNTSDRYKHCWISIYGTFSGKKWTQIFKIILKVILSLDFISILHWIRFNLERKKKMFTKWKFLIEQLELNVYFFLCISVADHTDRISLVKLGFWNFILFYNLIKFCNFFLLKWNPDRLTEQK